MELYYGVIPSSEEKGTNLYVLRKLPQLFFIDKTTQYTHTVGLELKISPSALQLQEKEVCHLN